MNDDWSRCPICFEDYSSSHRPTTFTCGHSTCIDHVRGADPLRHCPICRDPLRQGIVYHVSYNLEEGARLFQSIKNAIDWSMVEPPSAPDANDPRNSTLEMIHRDEVYARRLQDELNHENTTNPQGSAQTPGGNQTASGVNPLHGHLKDCGHRCDLVSTRQCCTCSDRRPHPRDGRYEVYVDGRGIVNRATRNEYYCSTCKRR